MGSSRFHFQLCAVYRPRGHRFRAGLRWTGGFPVTWTCIDCPAFLCRAHDDRRSLRDPEHRRPESQPKPFDRLFGSGILDVVVGSDWRVSRYTDSDHWIGGVEALSSRGRERSWLRKFPDAKVPAYLVVDFTVRLCASIFEAKSFTKSWLTTGFMIVYVSIADLLNLVHPACQS